MPYYCYIVCTKCDDCLEKLSYIFVWGPPCAFCNARQCHCHISALFDCVLQVRLEPLFLIEDYSKIFGLVWWLNCNSIGCNWCLCLRSFVTGEMHQYVLRCFKLRSMFLPPVYPLFSAILRPEGWDPERLIGRPAMGSSVSTCRGMYVNTGHGMCVGIKRVDT